MQKFAGCIVVASLALTGCPPPLPPATAPTPAPAPTVPAPQDSSLLPDLGYTVSAPQLVSRPGRVRVRPLARSALSVAWADRSTYLVVRGWGGRLASPRRRRSASLPRRHIIHSAFSPGRRFLAVTDQRRRLLVLSVPDARVIVDLPRAEAPKWIGDTVVAFRRGCTAMRLDVTSRAAPPVTIGSIPSPCRDVVRVSDDYATWTIADRGELRRGRWLVHTALRVADLRTGTVKTLRAAPFMAPRIAPRGDRLCWLEENFDLYCSDTRGATEKIWSNVRRPIQFDDTGRRLLFAVGERRDPTSELFVVNFRERAIVRLPRAGREWWVFLAGGARVAGHGGDSSGLVYDLAANWSAEIGDPKSEWEGMWPLPGDPNRLAVGRERRGSRDLFWVTIRD